MSVRKARGGVPVLSGKEGVCVTQRDYINQYRAVAICIGESWHTNIRDDGAPILRRHGKNRREIVAGQE